MCNCIYINIDRCRKSESQDHIYIYFQRSFYDETLDLDITLVREVYTELSIYMWLFFSFANSQLIVIFVKYVLSDFFFMIWRLWKCNGFKEITYIILIIINVCFFGIFQTYRFCSPSVWYGYDFNHEKVNFSFG